MTVEVTYDAVTSDRSRICLFSITDPGLHGYCRIPVRLVGVASNADERSCQSGCIPRFFNSHPPSGSVSAGGLSCGESPASCTGSSLRRLPGRNILRYAGRCDGSVGGLDRAPCGRTKKLFSAESFHMCGVLLKHVRRAIVVHGQGRRLGDNQ